MELNIFQDTLVMIQKNFPDRKDPLLLLLLDKPGDCRIKLLAKQSYGFKD